MRHGHGERLFVTFAFLFDLAVEHLARTQHGCGQLRTRSENLSDKHRDLLFATGPFADRLEAIGVELLAIHDAAVGDKFLYFVLSLSS